MDTVGPSTEDQREAAPDAPAKQRHACKQDDRMPFAQTWARTEGRVVMADPRRDLCDGVAMVRGEIEELRSAFRQHKALLSTEAQEEMDWQLTSLESAVEEFEMLAEDDDSYAKDSGDA